MPDYLNRILIYLKQELPPQYSEMLQLDGWVLKFVLPNNESFNEMFNDIKSKTERCILVIKERKANLDFTVYSPNQERDFKIYK